MREIRPYGFEGGEAKAFPTPILVEAKKLESDNTFLSLNIVSVKQPWARPPYWGFILWFTTILKLKYIYIKRLFSIWKYTPNGINRLFR